jgi:hypothetical protein
VYYQATAGIANSVNSSRRLIFRERNAVPFVINDGTGRILVLARYAGWVAADGFIDEITKGRAASNLEPGSDNSTFDWTDLAPAPPCLEAYWDKKYDMPFVASHGRESRVDIGQRVTVTGSVVPYASVIERNARGSVDGGASLALAGDLVVAPTRYSFTGLVVMAGTAAEIRNRGRARVAIAAIGLTLVAVGLAALLIGVPIIVANSQ